MDQSHSTQPSSPSESCCKADPYHTVTPLSKALAMIVFITLPIGTFFLGMQMVLPKIIEVPYPVVMARVEQVGTPSASVSIFAGEDPKKSQNSPVVTKPSAQALQKLPDGWYTKHFSKEEIDSNQGISMDILIPNGWLMTISSENTIVSDLPGQQWDYWSSAMVRDGKLQSSYLGGSRREWFLNEIKRRLNTTVTIKNIEEKIFQNISYLKVTAGDSGNEGVYYVVVSDGFAHVASYIGWVPQTIDESKYIPLILGSIRNITYSEGN